MNTKATILLALSICSAMAASSEIGGGIIVAKKSTKKHSLASGRGVVIKASTKKPSSVAGEAGAAKKPSSAGEGATIAEFVQESDSVGGGVIVVRGLADKPLEWDEDASWASRPFTYTRIYDDLLRSSGCYDEILAREGIARNAKRLYALARHIIDEEDEPVSFATQFILSELTPDQMAKLKEKVDPSRREFINQALECDEDADWAAQSFTHRNIYEDLREGFERRDEILASVGIADNAKRLYALARYIINWESEPVSFATQFILSELTPEQMAKLKKEADPECCEFIRQALECDEDMNWASLKHIHRDIYDELQEDFEGRDEILVREGVANNATRLYALAKYIIYKSHKPVSLATQFVLSKLSPEQLSKLEKEASSSRRGFVRQVLEWDEDREWVSNRHTLMRIYDELQEDFEGRDEILVREGVANNATRLYALAKYIIDKSFEPVSSAAQFVLSKLSPEQFSKLEERVQENRRQYVAQKL